MAAIDPKLRKALTGISGILVTPFDAQDQVAPARLQPILDRAIRAGVHILVANGNTGEFYGLTTAEAERMVHAVAEQIAGRALARWRRPQPRGRLRAGQSLARGGRVGADGASAARPLRLAPRRGGLCGARRRGGRPPAHALPAQRRHWPRYD